MLHKDQEQRITPKEALKHPWFKNEKLPLKESVEMNKYLADATKSRSCEREPLLV